MSRIILITCLLILCFIPIHTLNDYHLESFSFKDDSNSSMEGELVYKNETFNVDDYHITPMQNKANVDLIKDLHLSISLECGSTLHIKVTDKNNPRWEPPYVIDEKYKKKIQSCKKKKSLADFGMKFEADPQLPFNFELKNDDETYYTWKDGNFLYSDTLITFEAFVTSGDIYGFGERYHKFKLNDGRYTTWPNDTSGIHEDKETGGFNLMGAHPIGLHRTSKGLFVGLIFVNINAQDLVIKTISEKRVSLEHRTIGGILEYYLVIGKTPDEVLSQIHDVIGYPILPPLWSLGWHQCRWGYKNDTELKYVLARYEEEQIPIDVLWTDIDSMDHYRIFSIDKKNYAGLPQLITDIHKKGMKYVPIIDLGYAISDDDPYYNKGKKDKSFIMSNYTKEPLISEVWPGKTVFPDFFHPKAVDLWKEGLTDYQQIVHFDGIWLDMNEPAMLGVLLDGRGEFCDKYDPQFNKYEYIPYIPGYTPFAHTDITAHGISENAISYGDPKMMTTYNIRPMISYMEAKATYEYLQEKNKRPFILSRSTVMGEEKVAFHWLGDNESTYEFMKQTLPGIFSFQIFGIPMTGADICGLNKNATDVLCARWHSLGAFYPFSRNHNAFDAISQEPFALGPLTLASAKRALGLRYSLMRYLYTQMFLISLRGGSFFKPVFFEFPKDPHAYEDIDSTFMFGKAFYHIPNFSPTIEDIKAYFPNANWNTFPKGKNFVDYIPNSPSGTTQTLDGDYNFVHLYMRGGNIVPRQETINPVKRNIPQLRKIPTEVIINPDESQQAQGEVIFDEGEENDVLVEGDYLHVEMYFKYNVLLFNKKNEFKTPYTFMDLNISKIVLFRGQYLGHVVFAEVIDQYHNSHYSSVQINQETGSLFIDISNLHMTFQDIKKVEFLTDSTPFLKFVE